jgi:hypothetical protein
MSELVVKLHHLHPAQQQIMAESKRFNVLKCGRRFGKTDLTKELTIQPMLDGFPVGYWCPTYKDLHDVWNELKTTLYDVTETSSEQVKQLKLITGGVLDMWSLDDPNSGRGRKYKRVIVDEAEKARHLKDGWEQTIRATLVDYAGDAWFMSTPKFGQTYFKNTLFQNEKRFADWKSWRFTSYDNPFLPHSEVDAARAQLDDLTFRCEYLAEDVDVTLRPFAYSFIEDKHVGKCSFDPNYELMLSFDFNVDPITCVAAQHIENKEGMMELRFVKEFQLSNSNIYDLCDAITATFGLYNPLYLVTGDATGRARSAITTGNLNYYRVIQQKLELSDLQIKTPRINPAVSDSRVLVNSMLQNYNIVIDKGSCPGLVYDLKYVEVDEHGDIKKDRSSDAKKADLLDGCRYLCHTFFKWFLKSGIQEGE